MTARKLRHEMDEVFDSAPATLKPPCGGLSDLPEKPMLRIGPPA